jgi:hypothetical protein
VKKSSRRLQKGDTRSCGVAGFEGEAEEQQSTQKGERFRFDSAHMGY